MRIRSLLVSGVAAIALLGIAAVIAISVLSDRAAGVADAPTPEAAPVVADPARPLPAALVQPASGSTVPPPAPLVPPPDGGPPPWEGVPISARAAQLGIAVAGAVQQGLDAARDDMDPCFAQEAQRLRTAPPPTGLGSPLLTLELESRDGTIVVVDSTVESLGHSTAELVECCRRVLRGYVIRAPAAPPGERYRLRHVLQ